MANPLKQFEITPLLPLHVGNFDVSFTNSSLWMAIGVVVSLIFMTLAVKPKAQVPGRLQMASEMLYEFIASMIRENVGPKGRKFFPLIFTLFVVVMLGNSLGLIPFSFTYTSHIIVTVALALMIFMMVIVIGFFKHGFHFFSLFIPPGTPVWLAPFIFVLELVSFFVRPITLSVRLFANMMAGHIVLKVFAGFAVSFIALGSVGYLAAIVPTVFNAVLIAFELLIAYLQAYVFTILSCIYLKDALEIEH
ncbi:MAG: F0F1 ATP synthase subunit A [Micavibrio sp.]|nr:F0F1 ATP synthase subunit A [Micavibrio sp.]|tara:strand:- start:297472 stop:298218 length:747 start_codon:yes stop_codon:yes gene_type:complete